MLYSDWMYLMTGLIAGFVIGAILVTAVLVFSSKNTNDTDERMGGVGNKAEKT